jgi:adenylate cyclase
MVDPGYEQATPGGELRNLRALVEEVDASLRSQREILKRRGMNLPPMVLQNVATVKTDLEKLEGGLVEEQTELGQLRALADMSAMINSSLDLDEVLTQAIDVVINLTGAERGYIILKDLNTGALDFRIARDNELGARRGDGTIQISNSILNEVIATGEPLLADNAYKDERLQGNMSIANFALRSVLCVPLKRKNQVIGVVYVDNRLRAGVFTEREKALLVAFANQASVAIENARLFSSIQKALTEITAIQELMSNVFASIGSGVITTDAVDKVMTFNPAAAQILERQAEETLGKRLSHVLPRIATDFDEHLTQVRENNEAQHIDAEMEVPQRGRIAVSLKLSPLKDADQRTQGVAMVLDDLTDQREREETLNIMKRYLPPQLVANIRSIAELDLGGERREVTCMFVDVRPISTLPKDLRPQQRLEIINTYLSVVTECVHQANGVIDKYMGNEVMVLFNSQLNPMENHAVQAVEAALLIREGFIKLYAELGINPDPHYYRMGMHSGVATLGNVGSLTRRDFTAIGDTINLSKRVEENTQDGQIIISEDTLKYMEGFPAEHIGLVALGERQVKGRVQPIHFYEVFRA